MTTCIVGRGVVGLPVVPPPRAFLLREARKRKLSRALAAKRELPRS